MGTATVKVHLAVKRRAVACGLIPPPKAKSRDPSAVTCNNCQRTLHMADAELRVRAPRFLR